MIRGVVSDFGGVLTTPMHAAFAVYQEASGIPLEALNTAMRSAHARHGTDPLAELECGRITQPEFFARLEAELESALGRPVSMADFSDRLWAALDANTELWDYYAHLRSARPELRWALLTNNVREWEVHWRALLPVDEVFDVVVDSAYVGVRKPDPEAYALTLERMGLEAADCVFVDDIEANVIAARELGFATVHFTSTEETIARLRQLCEPSRSQQ